MADELAEEAATAVQVPYAYISQLRTLRSLVGKMQKRAVTILMDIAINHPRPKVKHADVPRLLKLNSPATLVKSSIAGHTFAEVSSTIIQSTKCLARFSRSQKINNACVPRPFFVQNLPIRHRVPRNITFQRGSKVTHPSHRLVVYRGLLYCDRCGYLSVSRTDRLAAPCMSIEEQVRGNLEALRLDALPKHVRSWASKVAP